MRVEHVGAGRGDHTLHCLHRQASLRDHPVLVTPPEQLGAEAPSSLLLLGDPGLGRLWPLLPRCHDQHGHPVPAGDVGEEGCTAAELDVVRVGADGQDSHSALCEAAAASRRR